MKKRTRMALASKEPHYNPTRLMRMVRKLKDMYVLQVVQGKLSPDDLPTEGQLVTQAQELLK